MKHTVTISPKTHMGWALEYNNQGGNDTPWVARHPEKPRVSIYRETLTSLLCEIEKRERGMCRLHAPIPVAIKSFYTTRRTNAEIFAYDEQCAYLRTDSGEVITEFLSNIKSGNSTDVRLRNAEYDQLINEANEAKRALADAQARCHQVSRKFVRVTVEAIKSAPFTKDEIK